MKAANRIALENRINFCQTSAARLNVLANSDMHESFKREAATLSRNYYAEARHYLFDLIDMGPAA